MSNRFASFNCSDEQLTALSEVRILAEHMEELIKEEVRATMGRGDICVPLHRVRNIKRYQALAMTHLETAVMFANKGISRREL